MKRYTIILCWLLSLAACVKDPSVAPIPADLSAVRLTVRPEAAAVLSRAVDENEVRDVNFYLVHRITGMAYHAYAEGESASLSLPQGDYTAYAVANAGRDLGETDPDRLPALPLPVPEAGELTTLPMSGVAELSVTGPGGLPPVTVKRNMAKLNLSLRVDPAAAGLKLVSYRPMNVPTTVRPFLPQGELSSSDLSDYGNGEAVPISGNTCSVTLYLPENLQGVNDKIDDPRQKNRENAPYCATYIAVRVSDGTSVYDFAVYPGANNTSDFNIRGNGVYNMTVTVRGTDRVDARMDFYTVSLTEEPSSNSGYRVAGETIEGTVTVESSDPSRRFQVLIRPDSPDDFYLDAKNSPEYRFDLNGRGSLSYSIDYIPTVYGPQNDRTAYTVEVTDEEGYTTALRREHRYANSLVVYVPLSPGGTLSATGALYCSEVRTNDYLRYEIHTPGTGCTLTPQPLAGSTFLGWYAPPNYSKPVSTDAPYAFVASSSRQELYTRFSVPEERLDIRGTANCYIATQKNTAYLFRSGVKGNGRQTTGLSAPTANDIVSAAVLWESGTRGSVISSVEMKGGDIAFTTGDTYGNALIGGFDAAGGIEWSWHIWFAPYDPDASAQAYTGGVTFMDRNLGALSATPGDAAAHGMYYQWGRKDPFPAGAEELNCLTGYEYRTVRGEDNKGMTLAYAIANPTHYIVGEEERIPGIGYNYKNWLLTPNHNLWGNASPSENSYVDASDKSIYDPCPPGWKLPNRGAWSNAGISPLRMTRTEGGFYLWYNQNDDYAYYPFTGELLGDSPLPAKPQRALYWSASPGPGSDLTTVLTNEVQGLGISNENGLGVVQPLMYSYPSRGCPVRCVRE